MKANELIRLADCFYCWASSSEELPADSDDLKTVLKGLEGLETHKARKAYAEKNLEHLSSGSSRIVYRSPEKTVIKLAKNDRGIAQNEVEANPDMKSKYINPTISHAKNHSWIEVPYLEKITEKEFEEMTGIKFSDFGTCLRYALRHVSGNTDKDKPKELYEVKKSEIFKELEKMGKKFKLLGGDMARISSWAAKDGHPILIDAGLTRGIYDRFYEDSSSS